MHSTGESMTLRTDSPLRRNESETTEVASCCGLQPCAKTEGLNPRRGDEFPPLFVPLQQYLCTCLFGLSFCCGVLSLDVVFHRFVCLFSARLDQLTCQRTRVGSRLEHPILLGVVVRYTECHVGHRAVHAVRAQPSHEHFGEYC